MSPETLQVMEGSQTSYRLMTGPEARRLAMKIPVARHQEAGISDMEGIWQYHELEGNEEHNGNADIHSE